MRNRFLKSFIFLLSSIYDNLFMLISMMIPRDKKVFIFGAWWGEKYDDNSKALFEYVVRNRPDLKTYWFSSNKAIVDKVRQIGFPAVYSRSWQAVFIALRAGYECYCTSNEDVGKNIKKYLGGCTIINLWHGVVTKKIVYDDDNTKKRIGHIQKINIAIENFAKRNWYVVCTSEVYYPIFESAFRKSRDKILNIGQARNDSLFIDTPNIYRELFPGKKIILYMPTHRQQGGVNMDLKQILPLHDLEALIERHHAILLIKKHFYHRNEQSFGDVFDNIKDITNENPETSVLLKAADILITDYSSCYNDHLLLNRPQIFYCFDFEDYQINDREMYFDYYSNVPGPICKTSEQLLKELDDALSGVDNYQDKRRRQLDFFYSKENQGIVAPRQLETILSL